MSRRKALYCLITLTVMTLITLAAGCINIDTPGFSTVSGSGELETREMDHADFTRLDISYAFRAEVTRGDAFSVRITLDDNLYDYLEIKQRGDTLHIGMASNHNYRDSTKIAAITMPSIEQLELSGASTGNISGFGPEPSLKFKVSGASSLSIDKVRAGNVGFDISGASHISGSMDMDEVDLDVSGASSIELGGTAVDITMDVSGASRLSLASFAATNVNVDLSGASNAVINVSGTLDVDLSGSSRLSYTGNPTIGDISVSGGSTITEK